ncbi:ABC transporter permease [Actinokineospora soli]|uniref:ABC transporter permease n=2 Tax=Actinokineospora soli TaxID=1048753 RepID=A0ABW2TIQ7_9PSEU
MTSAYPTPVDTLADKVRALAVELGRSSRNQVMKTFKVGAPKASAALDLLRTEHPAADRDETPSTTGVTEPTRSVPSPTTDAPAPADPVGPARHLHAVPADDTEPDQPASATGADDASPVSPQSTTGADPGTVAAAGDRPRRRVRSHRWALLLIAAGAFVAIWGGWVGLGKLTGFGEIALLPGIADGFTVDSAITLPLGMEAYAAYALRVWLSGATPLRARRFAKWSTIAALTLGAVGQVAYHLMTAAQVTAAPWPITTFVSCLPVVVLGCAAALTHLTHDDTEEATR